VELYVAADDQSELKRYDWNPTTKTFDKKKIGKLESGIFTWNVTTTRL